MIKRSGLKPPGYFRVCRHDPTFQVCNVRETACRMALGHLDGGEEVVNDVNFPDGDFTVSGAEPVYEIPNVFPCWGTTYILSEPADSLAAMPGSWIFSRRRPDDDFSIINALASGGLHSDDGRHFSLDDLPLPLRIAAARTCHDPDLLEKIAGSVCELEFDESGRPSGLKFERWKGGIRPRISNYDLFKAVVANPFLPDDYKAAMILVPGVQGGNPVVGEYRDGKTHVWEYLRANSYIPWGHFASNMAHDSVRYDIKTLSPDDVKGLRHLYYQRVYINMLISMADDVSAGACPEMSGAGNIRYVTRLDCLREKALEQMKLFMDSGRKLPFNAAMWGWNYGFDMSHSGYRLHASNQQIHQQFALIPSVIEDSGGAGHSSYSAGDHVAELVVSYRDEYERSFFDDLVHAITTNSRTDGRSDLESSLVIYEDANAMLFVPKAQRFQSELQIMAKRMAGNVMEADNEMRSSLDYMIWLAVRLLAEAGAEMVTCFEMSSRFDMIGHDQRIMYCFLPKHPLSPGSFSELQGRWITGHYPEDVAESLRRRLEWIG